MRSPEQKYHGILQQLVEKIEKVITRVKKLESNRQLFDVTNEISPDLFTSSPQNNLDSQNADILRLTMNQNTTLTGVGGGKKGRFLELYNASVYTLTLTHGAETSLPSNRFSTPAGASAALAPGERARLYYDSTIERWTTG
jgi:hypothetical protein